MPWREAGTEASEAAQRLQIYCHCLRQIAAYPFILWFAHVQGQIKVNSLVYLTIDKILTRGFTRN